MTSLKRELLSRAWRGWPINLVILFLGASFAFGNEEESMKTFQVNEPFVFFQKESAKLANDDLLLTNLRVPEKAAGKGKEPRVVVLTISTAGQSEEIKLIENDARRKKSDPLAVALWKDYALLLRAVDAAKGSIQIEVSLAMTPEVLKGGWYYGQKKHKAWGTPESWVHVLEGTRGAKWLDPNNPVNQQKNP